RPVSPASLRCRSAASRRLAYFGFGRVDSARARASSSSVQATLMPNPHTAETRTPNRPLARVSATTPPSEWPSATTRSAGGTAGATAAARRPKEYDASASEPPCPGRSGATHRPGHRSFRRSSNPRHTSPVAPSPCSSNNTGAILWPPFLTRVASNAFIPPPSDRLALGPGGSHGTPGELAGWESSGISQDGGGRGDGGRRRGRDPGHRRGAEGPELSEGDDAQRSGMGEL